jgi:ribosomal protein S18 acetylase RimI-like enzyme
VTLEVRPLREEDRGWVRQTIRERWGSDLVVGHGVVYEPAALEGFVAMENGRPVGLLTFVVQGDACEIVTINALEEGRGVGTALVEAVRGIGSPRLWLVTTNDNRRAQGFYERAGFRLVAVRRGAVARSRELKPEIPAAGEGGVPIRDELEYEWRAGGDDDPPAPGGSG